MVAMGTGSFSSVMSKTHVNDGGAGRSLATSSSTTSLLFAPFAGGGMGKGRACIEPGDELRLRHVGDVENEKAVVPIAHVQPIADAQGMMTAWRPAIAQRAFLATRFPMAPPPTRPST